MFLRKPLRSMSSAWGMLRSGWRSAPRVPWMQWFGQRCWVPYDVSTVSVKGRSPWVLAKEMWLGVCQSCERRGR